MSVQQYVRFYAKDTKLRRDLDVSVLADTPAKMTGGFGGWEVVDRPKRVGMTRFKGKDPFRQDVPILFDGFSTKTPQDVAIATLMRMSLQPKELAPPPIIKIDGPVNRQDLDWIIETVDWDDQRTIKDIVGGVVVHLRLAMVVHLLQFVDDDVIITSPSLNLPKKRGGSTSVDGGDQNLKDIAQGIFGDPNLWWWIQQANPTITDPRQPIPRGTTIKIPHGLS